MKDEQREIADLRFLIKNNSSVIKPYFGLMFWQLQEGESALSPDEFASQGMSFNLDGEADEVLAAFTAGYIKIWLSAGDFNAASRFIAAELRMSADELLQSRQFWLNANRG